MKAKLNKLKFEDANILPKENELILENGINLNGFIKKGEDFLEKLDEDQKSIYQIFKERGNKIDRLNFLDVYNRHVWLKSNGKFRLKELTSALCHDLFGAELHLMIELHHFLYNNSVYYSNRFVSVLHSVINQPSQVDVESYYYFKLNIYELKLLLLAEKNSIFRDWLDEMLKPLKGEIDFLKDLLFKINQEIDIKDKYDFLFKQKLEEVKSNLNTEFIDVFESDEARSVLFDLMSNVMKLVAKPIEKVSIFEMAKLFIIDKIWSSDYLLSYESERSRAYLLYAYLIEPLNLQTPEGWCEKKGNKVFEIDKGKRKLDEDFAQHMHNSIRGVLTINF